MFFSSRRRHTRYWRDWSSDVCSSDLAAQSGCLACHKIGENGNDGPGPQLTDIADKLPKAAIRRTLENPTAPMPSYAGMEEDKKRELVDFLSQLRGEPEEVHGE